MKLLRATAPQVNGNDAFTKLLLHCDGANNSTSFPDASASARTVTANGNAKVSTAQSKFGGASAIFDGSGDTLSIPDAADLRPGTGDFTIDWWARLTTLTWGGYFNKGFTNTGGIYIQQNNGSGNAETYINGSNVFSPVAFSGDATWHHYALVRAGTAVNFYKDGTSIASATSSANLNNTSAITIGDDNSSDAPNGHIDEFRYSVGIARWTGTFTPPSGPYF